MTRRRIALATFVAGLIGAAPVYGDVIFETDDPFGGPFGLIGFDVCLDQSVGLRIDVTGGDFRLDRISVWFMNNDFSGETHPLVEVSLRPDAEDAEGGSVPSNIVLEEWTFNVSAVGWDPMLESVESADHPRLREGEQYWIVTESLAPCGLDGVWNWAAFGTGFVSTSLGYGETWQPGGMGAVVATIVEATPAAPCPWDCGDLADDEVGVPDLLAMLAQWGGSGLCDFNGNGVDVVDLLAMLENWGGCP